MGTLNVSMGAWVWRAVLGAALAGATTGAWAAHGYGLWGELKYPADFANFDYVDPSVPKGGELRMVSNLRLSTFDKYNPFTLRGSYPAFISSLMFEGLLTGALDENGTGYGLLAEDVSVAPDRLSATFRLRREARFNDGSPVRAADVKHSYEILVGPHVNPAYKTILTDVAGLDVMDERTVRYRFKTPNRELPLTVGGLPVFSRSWGNETDPNTGLRKTFDQVVTDPPIASGPYKIGPVKFGRDITYVRDPNYWAKDLPARKGLYNFDRITVKIYKRESSISCAFFRPVTGPAGSRASASVRVNSSKPNSGTVCPPDSRAMCSIPEGLSSETCACVRRWVWRWTTSG
jgi:microcin C transport system substrate-binding protein